MKTNRTSPDIAIILPAYNEEQTVTKTMEDFFSVYPNAEIYVINNASTDRTRALALAAYQSLGCKGRLVEEPRKGKASAIRKAFYEIEADVYVMADADLTYPASDLPKILAPVLEGKADMVCGNRHNAGVYSRENKRLLHNAGNKLVKWLINRLFSGSLEDILTGYRALSRRFVKNYPILCEGFELETEMTIHALDKGYTVQEVPTDYSDRPPGSTSKLNTFHDGMRVLTTIFSIFVRFRPLLFFSFCAIVFALLALLAGSFPVIEYFKTSEIARFPLAILATGLAILSMVSFAVAVILNALASAQRYNHALALLQWNDLNNSSKEK